jgi:hypothetical protein
MQDVSLPELGEMAIGFQEASDLLWKMSRGALRIAHVSIEDAVGERPFVLVFDREMRQFPQSPTRMGPAVWRNGYALLHEICHVEFALPDEYPRYEGDRPLCAACIMGGSQGRPAFCDAINHKGPGKSCRALLESRFDALKHPVDGPSPACTVQLTNNGR